MAELSGRNPAIKTGKAFGMKQSAERRRLLKQLGVLGAAGLPGAPIGHAAAVHAAHAAPAAAYVFFSRLEAAFVDAALSRLIPNDELGPGAVEAGVTYFIDRQLAGAWGGHARNYRQGPWQDGTPEQGFQSPMTPQEIYRAAIAEIDTHCASALGGRFAELPVAVQEVVLRDLQSGGIALREAPSALFFDMLWTNAQEGFFSDPMYGGNIDKAGWKLVGFPGVAAAYTEMIEDHDKPYRAVPVSIADVQQGLSRLDEHGHPIHVLLAEKAR
jgi:gluconate 2-dehydrogenase gamma chain